MTCADLCRKHGMSEGTFYNWKAKYSGMTVSDAKRLKVLEDENARLKKLMAEQMLDAAAMKELLSRKMVRPAVKRAAVAHLRARMDLSKRRACQIVGADRKMIRHRSIRPPETELRQRLRDLANKVAGSAIGACSCSCAARASLRASFASRRRFRIPNVVDDVTWDCLAAIPDTSPLSLEPMALQWRPHGNSPV